MRNLLLIEDDEGIRTQMKWALSKEFKVSLASDRNEAITFFKSNKFSVVILDLGLPPSTGDSTEGFACLKEILSHSSRAKVIVVTGNDEKENAFQAIGLGAYDFYQKPVDVESLKIVLDRAFYLTELEEKYSKLQEQASGEVILESMVGFCGSMQDLFKTIKKVSSTDATVTIAGESGTGKELVAKALHSLSIRRDKPFIPINCGSIPESLIETELFGYEKGAFTDAKNQKIGLVENASGGTLFLDEVGELPLHMQTKMLRFLQERQIQRVGGTKQIDVDLRVIAATNIDIKKAVEKGTFREDLFYRLSVINVSLPPLRERGEDILILAKTFIERFNKLTSRNIKGFTPEASKALLSYNWPGNVRELENKVHRAVIMANGVFLECCDLDLPEFKESAASSEVEADKSVEIEPLKKVRERAEIKALKDALLVAQGNISKAAKLLEITRPTFHDLINKHGIK